MRLNAEERALIEGRRAEKKKLVEHEAQAREALQVASRYARWLRTEGASNSYSSFINSFGYQKPQGREMYRVVTELLAVADTIGS
jgi:hypothetical protein